MLGQEWGAKPTRRAPALLFAGLVLALTCSSAWASTGAAGRIVHAAPSQARGATLARIVLGGPALSSPGGGRSVMQLSPSTSPGLQTQTLLVLRATTVRGQQWVRVLLPIRPDGSAGWVPVSRVDISHTDYWVSVSTETPQVSVYRLGKLVQSYPAVVGKPSTPTPLGLAAIYEEDPQPSPNDFVGTWALLLTALSNTLHSFDGGPGRVAIHGRGGASLLDPLGSAASHGCIRIDNGPVGWLAGHLPRGTPVDIT